MANDISQDSIAVAEAWGAEIAESPAAAARFCKLILLCLPGPAETKDAIVGEAGLLDQVGNEHIIIDLSTGDPETSAQLAEVISEKGGKFLDAPILGRPSSIGKWVLPIGGDDQTLEQSRPVLATFASHVVLVGPPGAGHTLKLLNQLMFATINAITAEIMALCKLTELGPDVLFTTIADSGAATVSGLFRESGRKIVAQDFEPIFSVDLLHKDTALGLKMAGRYGGFTPVAEQVQLQNELARSAGLGDEDSSALVKVYEQSR